MNLTELTNKVQRFYILLKYLDRNVGRVLVLMPEIVTQPMIKDYNTQVQKIINNYEMEYHFLDGVYRLLLLILNILDKTINNRNGTFYKKKYIKRVNRLRRERFGTIVELLNDINNDFINRLEEFNSLYVNAVNNSNIPYGQINRTNVNFLPEAYKIPNRFERANMRLVDIPINNNAPLANATIVKRSPGRNRTVKGIKI